ncbi:class I SAM-dependent methyltransferase [Hyphobacterium marinum]|uniref:Class I SAM-dependent methyltransferase n=1 Tax=Hyphobacterium marinum TaxID=3116574 RepID=A0ABU7LY94_9PROT|nr:class I SAM-dependent methyltransferase [Hyphobacterium sp. Y6023]MEE2566534.1 class I SAM-dependent methyltransferase [Hyphobacterium sp. Y6023]
MSFWSNTILPNLIGGACSTSPIMKQRAKIVPDADGVVVEIGMGAAPNLPLYDPSRVQTVIGVEPSPGLRKKAIRAIAGQSLDIELIDARAENLPLETGKADTIVLTYTLCSLPDVDGAFAEMRRILKPGGRLLFCEHGAAPDAGVLKWQRRLEPVWKRCAGGCHLARQIDRLITEGGFRINHLDAAYMPKTPKIVGFDYIGSARPN